MTDLKFNNYAMESGRRGMNIFYKWKVFVDEPEEVLKTIESVEYRLHETFPKPINIIEDRKTRFALEASGWGTFLIHLTVYLTDGSAVNTSYYLDLSKSWPEK